MQIQVKNYTFNKTAKTITFVDYPTIRLDGIRLITNVTTGVIIYMFSDPTLGGTVSSNVLTLAYNTAAMSNTDSLAIWYDDMVDSPATTTDMLDIENLLIVLRDAMEFLGILGTSRNSDGSLRVVLGVGAGSTIATVTTVGTVTTVSTVTTVGTVTTVAAVTALNQLGAYKADPVVPSLSNAAAIQSNIQNVIVT